MESRGQIETKVRYLEDILQDVNEGTIRVPCFQRPFVWSRKEMLNLLDSIYRGYPIGSLLVWETTQKYSAIEKVGPIEIKRWPDMVSYLLDGYQRITTLLGTLFPTEEQLKEDGDPRWRVYFDLETDPENPKHSMFVHLRGSQVDKSHYPIWKLLDTELFLDEQDRLRTHARDQFKVWSEKTKKLAAVFRKSSLAVTVMKGQSLEEATEIFARLNTAGRTVSPDQIFAALTYSEQDRQTFDLARRVDDMLEGELLELGYGELNRKTILRALLAALGRHIYARTVDWMKLAREEKDRLPSVMNDVEKSLVQSAKFLRIRMGMLSQKLLPYGIQMLLLSELFRIEHDPSEVQLSQIERWLWVTSFTGGFSVGNSSRFDDAVDSARKLARGESPRPDGFELDAPARSLPGQFHANSARARTFFLFLKEKQPQVPDPEKGWQTDDSLLSGGLADAVVVFRDGPKDVRYDLANRVLVGVRFAKDIRSMFSRLTQQEPEVRKRVLDSHIISYEAWQALCDGDARTFLQLRRQSLIGAEIEFMKAKGVHPPIQPYLTVEDEDDANSD